MIEKSQQFQRIKISRSKMPGNDADPCAAVETYLRRIVDDKLSFLMVNLKCMMLL
jgi:hypothetical protein